MRLAFDWRFRSLEFTITIEAESKAKSKHGAYESMFLKLKRRQRKA